MSLTLTTVVSGFTYVPASEIYAKITSVQFDVTFNGELLDFNSIWIFGDGTYNVTTDTQIAHTYSKPGTYLVTLIVFNTIEEFRAYLVQNSLALSAVPVTQEYLTFTQSVSVVNLVHDSITFTNVPSGVLQSRIQATPFRVEFSSSSNTTPVFQLYSENSLSQPWQSVDPKWSHLQPQWKFLDINGDEVDTLSPETSALHTLVKNGNASLSATPFDDTIPSTLVAGTSGYIDFYYVDDLPADVILHATLNTFNYDNPADAEHAYAPSYANSTLALTANYTISASDPTALRIDSNGIPSFTLEGTKWQNALIPYVISIVDVEGYVLRNYPLSNAAGDLYSINRVLVGVDSNGVTFELPDAYFQRYDENDKDAGGYFAGFFQPLSTIDVTQLSATVTIQTSAGNVVLTGSSVEFDIQVYSELFGISKINEDFNMAGTIKSYALQETIARNTVLFDELIGQIVGDGDSEPESIGKATHERIANYVENHSDVDKCNIDKLYSLCQEMGIPIEDYNLEYPSNLRRIMNIVSIPYARLKGSREKFARDFKQSLEMYSSPNLGEQLDTTTYQITAGVDIVIQEKHTDAYEIIHTVTLNSQFIYPLLALSAYNFKMPLDTYYNFYEYVPVYTDDLVEGVIDWENPGTTLTEGVSSIDVWLGDSGTVDAILDYQLRRGLELISN